MEILGAILIGVFFLAGLAHAMAWFVLAYREGWLKQRRLLKGKPMPWISLNPFRDWSDLGVAMSYSKERTSDPLAHKAARWVRWSFFVGLGAFLALFGSRLFAD